MFSSRHSLLQMEPAIQASECQEYLLSRGKHINTTLENQILTQFFFKCESIRLTLYLMNKKTLIYLTHYVIFSLLWINTEIPRCFQRNITKPSPGIMQKYPLGSKIQACINILYTRWPITFRKSIVQVGKIYLNLTEGQSLKLKQ